jgi:ATPase subunit of ABC transporter with duplicated ATPase domains
VQQLAADLGTIYDRMAQVQSFTSTWVEFLTCVENSHTRLTLSGGADCADWLCGHQIGADCAEGRAAAILTGLQFSEEMQRMPTSALSGGWR